eukprot:COSAG02_NODE_39151_length_420_cov_1.127726_1_plen_97_part_10
MSSPRDPLSIKGDRVANDYNGPIAYHLKQHTRHSYMQTWRWAEIVRLPDCLARASITEVGAARARVACCDPGRRLASDVALQRADGPSLAVGLCHL